ncbi:glycosyl transferase [Sphingobacteriaceae bacterium]|nr:glycosyl transferase [Sphingobacteriaceae bacterium]
MTRSNKKVAIIGTVGLPAKYGGFETLADHLVRNLGEKYDFTVYCTKKKYAVGERQKKYLSAKLKFLPFDANGIQSIFYDTISIVHALFYADVLLVLGVAGAWILPFVRLFTRKKIIISIDGIEWKREKWSLPAKLYLWWAEKIAVKFSHIDISDNESIQDYTALRYGSLSRIIEYGADHTAVVENTEQDYEDYPFIKLLYAVKVCRIEPENNVHMVLEAFTEIKNRTLVIIGNWNTSNYGRELRERYKNYANIILLDPIYNQRVIDMLRANATVYIHGHSAGGTNPSLVEAMYLGLPVIAFHVSYNKTTTENKAMYFSNSSDLREIILATSLDRYKHYANVMKEIATRRYNWKLIAQKYDLLITEALTSGKKISVHATLSNMQDKDLLKHNLGHLKHQHLFFEKP